MSATVYCVLLLGLLQVATSLKLIRIEVPHHLVLGRTIALKCIYDLEGIELYSIKWYKNGEEFYTYLPNDDPKARVHSVTGITLDLTASDASKVTLRNVQLNSSGNYKCEVSGEAPYFTTVTHEGEMNIIDLPKEGPKIMGSQPKYEVGDTVKVNCTSYKSKPAAMLSWTINGIMEEKKHLVEYPTNFDANGLETSVLGLEFQVHEHHFKFGEMKLKCTATIAPIYYQSNEESVLGGNQQASVLESKETLDKAKCALTVSGQLWFYLLNVITVLLLR